MTLERILIVDDEPQVRAMCAQALTGEGYDVLVARNGSDALQRAREESPQLAIIDVVMPGMDGIELCRSLRSTSGLSHLPILFLTAKRDITDKAAGYAVGGDDYLTKPFDIRELVMRVRALLRRASPTWFESEPRELTAGELRLDCNRFTVTTPEKTALLTPREFELMYYLMKYPGQVHSSEKLLQRVWGYPDSVGSSDLVRRHIKNIREKIEPDPSTPRYILTVRHHGYVLSN